MISIVFPKLNLILFRNLLVIWLIFQIAMTPGYLKAQDKTPYVFDAYRSHSAKWMKYRHLEDAWYDHLHQRADSYLTYRKAWVSSCTTQVMWDARRNSVSRRLWESIGGLPKKTFLNVKVVGTLERPSFTVEKILFESLPGFYVTAALFLPRESQTPAPAVIYCSGHTENGFRSETYQRVIINLVKKGFVVLAFDPIGQGERFQYLDEDGKPRMGSTHEHSYVGAQCLITGSSIAKYMIHDGIRAVDYLLTRPEVDPERIGITGRSGGGTQSAYIGAYDDRIYAVAPENYITSFQRLWESIGPQDGEQNIPGANLLEIDHGDLLEIRAPKPAMILTTTRDFFSIQGARETFREVQEIYSLYDQEQSLEFTEDDFGHGSTKANRQALYRFFQQHLDMPLDTQDLDVEVFSEQELTITETGQVVTALDSRSIFDLNLASVKDAQLPRENALMQKDSMRTLIQGIAGIVPEYEMPQAVFTGRIQQDDYTIEKYFLEFDSHYPLPFFWISQPSTQPQPLILYLNTDGKQAGMEPGGEIEQLLDAGYTVMAADLLNTGELKADDFRGDSYMKAVAYNLVYGSSLIGKSLTALQTEDLYYLMDFVRKQKDIDQSRITAVADKQTCIPLLHYAALNDDIQRVILKEPLTSWKELIATRDYAHEHTYTIVPGAYPAYDLPVLAAMIAPRELQIYDPVGAHGEVLAQDKWIETYEWVHVVFGNTGNINDFSVSTGDNWIGILRS